MYSKAAFLFLLVASFCHKSLGQPMMFRGNPEHSLATEPASQVVYGKESWSFNAGGPIRSTAAYNSNTIFFGSSNGKFYALDKKTGKIKWSFSGKHSINSSPALQNGKVFFSDNQQCLYALDASSGKTIWKYEFGPSRPYDWSFDYYFSSPTLVGNHVLIGAKDGYVYKIDQQSGKAVWKFKSEGIVRSTPAVKDGIVFFGDTDGILYAIDLSNGKESWRYLTVGNGLKNEDFGFDRRAIISSPVIKNDIVVFGCRDGFMYAINRNTGKELWRMDHQVSWVISSPAIVENTVVTGTSDGRFVQAVDLQTGKEIWKHRTSSIVWSSPIVQNDKVYIGSGEGNLFCIDLKTGQRLNAFQAKGKIFSSPVISDQALFFGTDNGYFYSLTNLTEVNPTSTALRRFVYWESGVNIHFRYGADVKVRDYLMDQRYQRIDGSRLTQLLNQNDSAKGTVIVFAANYFPPQSINLLKSFLSNGGRIVMLGVNPLAFKIDTVGKRFIGYNFLYPDSVLNLKYGKYNDLRSFGGIYPCFATEEGQKWGLPAFWTAPLGLDPKQVDVVLAKDENGLATAWIKRYNSYKGSGLLQIWVDGDGTMDDISFIIKAAEHDM